MNATIFSRVSGACASVLILLATATSRTLAADGSDTSVETNTACCGQSAIAIQTCVTCDTAPTRTESFLSAEAAVSAQTPARGPRHTVTAFGFVISGNKATAEAEWLERDAAAFAEIQSSRSWSRADAERQPRGLRLFTWSW